MRERNKPLQNLQHQVRFRLAHIAQPEGVQTDHTGTPGGTAAHHQHHVIVPARLGGLKDGIRIPAGQGLDVGHPVIPGVAAAAVFDA